MRDEVVELEDLGVVIAGTRQAGGADRGEGQSRRVSMDWSGAQSALACLLRADTACTVERNNNVLSTGLCPPDAKITCSSSGISESGSDALSSCTSYPDASDPPIVPPILSTHFASREQHTMSAALAALRRGHIWKE
jgi:hypothetical protein